jgi:hypothetical protein
MHASSTNAVRLQSCAKGSARGVAGWPAGRTEEAMKTLTLCWLISMLVAATLSSSRTAHAAGPSGAQCPLGNDAVASPTWVNQNANTPENYGCPAGSTDPSWYGPAVPTSITLGYNQVMTGVNSAGYVNIAGACVYEQGSYQEVAWSGFLNTTAGRHVGSGLNV